MSMQVDQETGKAKYWNKLLGGEKGVELCQ